jgi:ABC-type transport system involved in multi-copper enzyme maturation permease subunit
MNRYLQRFLHSSRLALALSFRDLLVRSRSLWYPVSICLALIALVFIHNNYWQHVYSQGVVTGNLLSTPLRLSITILLISIALDAAIAIPSEFEARTLAWLRVQPMSDNSFILGKFIGLIFVFVLSLGILTVLIGCILLISGTTLSFRSTGFFVYTLAAGVYMVGMGLWLGSALRTVKSSIGVALLVLSLLLAFSALSLWLQLRAIPSTYDPFYFLAKLAMIINAILEWLSPIRIFSQQSIGLTLKDLVYSLALTFQGCLGLLLAGRNLRRMTYLK